MSGKPAHRALAYIAGQPWLIRPPALEGMIAIAQRTLELDIEALEARLGAPLNNARQTTVRDGIATIFATGPLFRYANLFTRVSGATAFATLATDLRAALDDPAVKAIILEVNSPGGEVDGTLEMAKLILEARGVKPIVGRVGGEGASAAYWILSATDEIVATPTSVVGSLGAVVTVEDWSEADAKIGLRTYEFISAVSPKKRPDPATAAGKDEFQRIADALGRVMVESIAANRDVPLETVLESYGQGGVLVGAAAVEAGLVDRLATYEELHAELVERTRPRPSVVPLVPGITATKEGRMPPETKKDVPEGGAPARLTRAQLEEQYRAEIDATAAERSSAAVTAERQRLLALDELAAAKPGHAALITAAKADPAQTAETTALAIAKAEAKARDTHAAALAGDERQLDKPAPGAGQGEPGTDSAVAQRVLATHQAFGGRATPAATTQTRRSA